MSSESSSTIPSKPEYDYEAMVANYAPSAVIHYNRKYNKSPIPKFRLLPENEDGNGFQFHAGGEYFTIEIYLGDGTAGAEGLKIEINHSHHGVIDFVTFHNVQAAKALASHRPNPGCELREEVKEMLDNHLNWIRETIAFKMSIFGYYSDSQQA